MSDRESFSEYDDPYEYVMPRPSPQLIVKLQERELKLAWENHDLLLTALKDWISESKKLIILGGISADLLNRNKYLMAAEQAIKKAEQ